MNTKNVSAAHQIEQSVSFRVVKFSALKLIYARVRAILLFTFGVFSVFTEQQAWQ